MQVTAIYSGYNVSSRIDEHDCGRRAIVIQASLVGPINPRAVRLQYLLIQVIHVFSFATTLVGSLGCSMSTILIIMALNVVGSAALLALHACRDVVRRIETIVRFGLPLHNSCGQRNLGFLGIHRCHGDLDHHDARQCPTVPPTADGMRRTSECASSAHVAVTGVLQCLGTSAFLAPNAS